MEELPYIRLPKDFTYLLMKDMQSSSEAFKSLESYIHKNKSLFNLVSLFFDDLNVGVNIRKIINALGWHGFRERLGAGYLQYAHEGRFSKKINMTYIQDVIAFEEHFKDFSIQGYSRSFLFAYYLKMFEITESSMPGNLNIKHLIKDKELLEILKLSSSRSQKFDWLFFQVLHLKSFFGTETLKNKINSNMSYEDIIEEIEYTQRERYLNNALTYGASIKDSDIFTEKPI